MVVYFVYEGYQMDGNLGENDPSKYTEGKAFTFHIIISTGKSVCPSVDHKKLILSLKVKKKRQDISKR